ncbi:taxadiene 5-alpha hydroxylase [Silene latifolia]|uniref:taxadiene 5-alpha hydroxylase n=1 Tax=Silene latifolia TaxID=37657 RepID=UPI003D78120D
MRISDIEAIAVLCCDIYNGAFPNSEVICILHPVMAPYISSTLIINLLPYLVASSICILFLLQHKKSKIKNKTPPGNMGLPFIGETMEFYRAQQNNRLFEDFITPRIQKHGNTFKTKLMGSATVIVNGLEANRFFLANEFKLVVSSWPSSSVQLMGENSIMEKTGECHRSLRAILAPCLGGTGLEALVPKICKVVKAHLVKDWGNQKRVITLYKSAKFLIFTIMCECVLEMEAKEELFDCFERVLEGVFSPPLDVPGTSFWRAKKARKEIERELSSVVRKKRKEMEELDENVRSKDELKSLLSRLVGGLIKGEIREVEVIDNMVLFIFAAHDTTSFAIAMTFKMLAKHSNSYTTLLQEHMKIKGNKSPGNEGLTMEDLKEMKYTWQVVRETMRLSPPVFGSFRRAIKEFEFDGFTIPQGWKVLWTVYGTHYSEEYFREPHRFDPSRFEETVPPYVFLAFGGGPRMCAGNQLAKLNILIFVHLVVTNYDWSLVENDEPILMDPLPIPSKGMPITISPFFSNHSPNQ